MVFRSKVFEIGRISSKFVKTKFLPKRITFLNEHPKWLNFETIGGFSFKSKMTADDVIRNFQITVVSAVFYFSSLWFIRTCFRGFLKSKIFVVKYFAFKWLDCELKLQWLIKRRKSGKRPNRATLTTRKLGSVTQCSLKNFKNSFRFSECWVSSDRKIYHQDSWRFT